MTTIARRLAGRTALVTGGSRGIGRAVAERFAREGALVAVGHLGDAARAEAVVASLGTIDATQGLGARPHHAVEADLGSEAAIEAMVAAVVERFGRLDIRVNNAGMQAPTPGADFDAATFERILAVDLTGAALAARAAIRHFLTRPGGGVIVNTTSVHEIIPKPGFAAYAAAKAGLGHLTRTLALEFAAAGIRVNAVGPGAVATEMNAAWTGDARARAAVEAHIPIGYAAEPEEIAPVFAFLASDDAAYVVGQTLYACGGLTLYGEFRHDWSS